ncbi:MAG: cupin domain-containing protein [Pseudomonadota bacterium]|jgi:mannose-6-phosphate isomerase-like protein (cupin superfamily)
MTFGPLVSVRQIENYSGGIQLKELDLEDGETRVTPFKASIISVPPGVSTPVDQHDVRECWVVIAGQGELTTDGIASRLEPGAVTYFASGCAHQVRNIGSDELKFFSAWWSPNG